eukprot:Nk52_evm19s210 gene=Nk52_evmTU19s210
MSKTQSQLRGALVVFALTACIAMVTAGKASSSKDAAAEVVRRSVQNLVSSSKPHAVSHRGTISNKVAEHEKTGSTTFSMPEGMGQSLFGNNGNSDVNEEALNNLMDATLMGDMMSINPGNPSFSTPQNIDESEAERFDEMEKEIIEQSEELGRETANALLNTLFDTDGSVKLANYGSDQDLHDAKTEIQLVNAVIDGLDKDMRDAIEQTSQSMGDDYSFERMLDDLSTTLNDIEKVLEESEHEAQQQQQSEPYDPLGLGFLDILMGPPAKASPSFLLPDFGITEQDFKPTASKSMCRGINVLRCIIRLANVSNKEFESVCSDKPLETCVENLMKDSKPHTVHKKKAVKKHHKHHKKHHKHHNQELVDKKNLPEYPCMGKSLKACYSFVKEHKEAYCGKLNMIKCVYNVKMDQKYDGKITNREHIREVIHRHRFLLQFSVVAFFMLCFVLVFFCVRKCARNARRRKRERYSMVPDFEDDSKFLLSGATKEGEEQA